MLLLCDQTYFHLVDNKTQTAPLRYSLDCKHLRSCSLKCVASSALVCYHRNPREMDIQEIDGDISVNPYEKAFDSLASSLDLECRGNLNKIHPKEISCCLPFSVQVRTSFWTDVIRLLFSPRVRESDTNVSF